MGISNPLNLEVQAACAKSPEQLKAEREQEELYSKYQDFKCAGADVDRDDNGAGGIGYMDLPSAAGNDGDGPGYMDIPVSGAAGAGADDGPGPGYMDLLQGGSAPALAPAPAPTKLNAAGKVRPARPGRPSRPVSSPTHTHHFSGCLSLS